MGSLVENSPMVLEKTIFRFRQCIFAISICFPFGNGRNPLYEKKIESPSTKNALCQVWLKLAQWYRFWEDIYIYKYFWYLSVIFLWKTAWAFISWHTRMFCAKFGLNGPVTLERKTIMWNVNDNNDNKDYDMTSSIRKTHLSLQLRWAKKWRWHQCS